MLHILQAIKINYARYVIYLYNIAYISHLIKYFKNVLIIYIIIYFNGSENKE